MPCVILPHLHLLHAVGREPACAAFHGPLPETALPNAEHWGDRSQKGGQAGAGSGSPPLHPSPTTPQAKVLPAHPAPFLGSSPPPSRLFPWKDCGIHKEQKQTDGPSTGWACGGQRDTQMNTRGGRRQRQGPLPRGPALRVAVCGQGIRPQMDQGGLTPSCPSLRLPRAHSTHEDRAPAM